MKRQDITKAHQDTPALLKSTLAKKEQQLVEVKLKLSLDQLKNTSQLKNLKKDIAQLKTIIHFKELEPKPSDQPKGTS
jgi:ribosomal protein L29